MGTVVLGWLLISIGLFATIAGIGGGVATMFREIQRKVDKDRSYGGVPFPTEFLRALTEFIKALSHAPVWFALTLIGFVLIAWHICC